MAITKNLGKVVPEKGVDYYTEEEKEQFKEEVEQEFQEQITTNTNDISNLEEVNGIDTDTFSPSNTYKVGDIVVYNNKVYRCITAITTAGDWDSTKWEELSIRQELDEKEARIQELEEDNKLILSNFNTANAVIEGSGQLTNSLHWNIDKLNSFGAGDFSQAETASPENPQPVKVLSGNVSVDFGNKNIFDIDIASSRVKNGYIVAQPVIGDNGSTNKITYIDIEPNTTYTVSRSIVPAGSPSAVDFAIGTCSLIPAKDVVLNSHAYANATAHVQSLTVTSTSDDKYLAIYMKNGGITINNLLDIIQVEKSSTAHLPYAPHEKQTFPLTLPEGMILGNISTAKNKIFQNTKDNPNYNSSLIEDAWYYVKNVKEIVLNGTETWNISTNTSYNFNLFYNEVNFSDYLKASGLTVLCTRFKGGNNASNSTGVFSQGENIVCFRNNPNDNLKTLYITNSSSNVNEFKTLLANTNPILYYALATPTYTQITDTTLISQLEAIRDYMKTYKNITNITITGGDINGVLDFDYFVDDRVDENGVSVLDKLTALEARVELLEN